MNFSKLPRVLDLGEYGSSNQQVSPRTDGVVYYGLGNQIQGNQRGLLISGVFYLVHITVPNAPDFLYGHKNDSAGRHMKHFHVTLSEPGADPRDNKHFHFASDRPGGKVSQLNSIRFEGNRGGVATGRSDWDSRILDTKKQTSTPLQAERFRRWNEMQLNLLAAAFLTTVRGPVA
jgi:hypothetical protein